MTEANKGRIMKIKPIEDKLKNIKLEMLSVEIGYNLTPQEKDELEKIVNKYLDDCLKVIGDFNK